MASDSGFCTSEEDDPRPLTRAEKAARTRALKAEAEHARNEVLMAETSDSSSLVVFIPLTCENSGRPFSQKESTHEKRYVVFGG